MVRTEPPADRRRRRGPAAAAAGHGLRRRPCRRHLRHGDRDRPARVPAQRRDRRRTAPADRPRSRRSDRLARTVVGGTPSALREIEAIRSSGPTLSGKVVVIDPGHGGSDPGNVGHGLAEADLAEELAARIEGRLAATGVTAYLSRARLARARDSRPTSPRARRRRTACRPTCCCRCTSTAAPTPGPNGVATYYYGDRSPRDPVRDRGAVRVAAAARADRAHRPARLRHARQDLGPAAAHPDARGAARAGLRHQPRRRGRLADPGFRDVVAEAVVVAVQRLYLPPHEDAPTGSIRLPDLSAADPVRSGWRRRGTAAPRRGSAPAPRRRGPATSRPSAGPAAAAGCGHARGRGRSPPTPGSPAGSTQVCATAPYASIARTPRWVRSFAAACTRTRPRPAAAVLGARRTRPSAARRPGRSARSGTPPPAARTPAARTSRSRPARRRRRRAARTGPTRPRCSSTHSALTSAWATAPPGRPRGAGPGLPEGAVPARLRQVAERLPGDRDDPAAH